MDGYAFAYFIALLVGAYVAGTKGGRAEQQTMCLIICVWLGTLYVNHVTGSFAPYISYAIIDIGVLLVLWDRQLRNWQWLPAGLFTAMLLTHLTFWTLGMTGVMADGARPYQDVLAVLSYLTILSVGWASWERARDRGGGNIGGLGRWALSTDWLPLGARNHHGHAGA